MGEIPTDGIDLGRSIDSAIIERGLRELCPSLDFDLAGRKDQLHPYINDRQGVYYDGRHICSLDRGVVPEFKIWDVKRTVFPVEWWEADKDDVSIQFKSLLKSDPDYEEMMAKAARGNDPGVVKRTDGTVIRCIPVAHRPARHRVIRVGWRHTFERILAFGVPGVTRESLSKKFGIDMGRFALGGAPDEIAAMVLEE